MNKKITIFIPCYNRIRYIDSALESVVNQDYKNKNIVVMDDCSNDGSYERLQELQKKWDFTLLKTDRPQRGTYWISNRIIETFDTEYFQVLDSDDMLLENATSKLVEFMEKESAELVGGQHILIDAKGNVIEHPKKYNWRPYNPNFAYKIKRGQYINRSGMVWKRQVIDKIGKFNESSICSMDYDFAVRALESNIVIRNLPFQIVKYRVHKESLNNSDLFGIENKEKIKNNEYFKKKYPFYYIFAEDYLAFFERELDMVIDEKRIVVEGWFAEYIRKLNEENKIKDIKKAVSLLGKCKYALDAKAALGSF
jgi:glycosyltransferase involved in cell wall biosynthesis